MRRGECVSGNVSVVAKRELNRKGKAIDLPVDISSNPQLGGYSYELWAVTERMRAAEMSVLCRVAGLRDGVRSSDIPRELGVESAKWFRHGIFMISFGCFPGMSNW